MDFVVYDCEEFVFGVVCGFGCFFGGEEGVFVIFVLGDVGVDVD